MESRQVGIRRGLYQNSMLRTDMNVAFFKILYESVNICATTSQFRSQFPLDEVPQLGPKG